MYCDNDNVAGRRLEGKSSCETLYQHEIIR
ncbi:Uncharacterised protein [Zhongshania aliphaticivorans]|uniref:Uncharacterized protein n=1 Tax=Zhongshania aliphaticivorans TaxID=1470434 RepID=A0A5S9NHA5_9GAMM|nr:Uncharacterised protein [Zhongshania aliphaticivorans]CAA0095703.1 Uncharacterised protein [Zhongshania aliphaticivorans]